jgi:hypothetical protein
MKRNTWSSDSSFAEAADNAEARSNAPAAQNMDGDDRSQRSGRVANDGDRPVLKLLHSIAHSTQHTVKTLTENSSKGKMDE